MEKLIKDVFEGASENAGTLIDTNLTYIADDGLRHCRKCNKKLETILHFTSPVLIAAGMDGMKVNCICNCIEEERKKIREELKQIEQSNDIERQRRLCFKSESMHRMIFAIDDDLTSEASKMSRRWVQNYDRNLQSGKPISWLFFYGGTGVGKTYYAACIANAMIEKGKKVKMTTGSEIEQEIFNAEDKADIYKRYASYDVLILDDLAAERKSDYMYEILYNIVNDRYMARKPMIITTNMTTADTVNIKDKRLERIMSRIYAYGYPIEIQGKDRRKQGAWK